MQYVCMILLWPFLNYIGENFDKINAYNDIFIMFFLIIFLSISLTILFKKIKSFSVDLLLLPMFSATALFFSYSLIVEFLGRYVMNFLFIKASYFYLILFILLIFLTCKMSKNIHIQKIFKIFLIVIFSVSALKVGSKVALSFFSDRESSVSYMDTKVEDFVKPYIFKYRPNVYYILIDAYARQDALKEIMDYDNEPFLKELENIGFIVSRSARSNYHFTGASLSATMNMSFHQSNEKGLFSTDQMHLSLMGKNSVRRVFHDNGYCIINIPAHWHEMRCHGNEDICVSGKSYEIYESFLSNTPLRAIHFQNSYVSFDSILKTISMSKERPKFVFSHIAQVHDAVFDESGEFHSTKHPTFSGKKDAARYLYSIKKTNDQLIDFINKLKKEDPDSIIIIQADHGPTYVGNLTPADSEYWLRYNHLIRLRKNEDYRYTFGILSAILIPESNSEYFLNIKRYFSGNFTLVNTFRYIFSYLSEVSPDLLPEKSLFLYYDDATLAYKEDDITVLTK